MHVCYWITPKLQNGSECNIVWKSSRTVSARGRRRGVSDSNWLIGRPLFALCGLPIATSAYISYYKLKKKIGRHRSIHITLQHIFSLLQPTTILTHQIVPPSSRYKLTTILPTAVAGWAGREGRPRNLGRGVSKPKKNTVASLLAQSRALGLRPALAHQLLAETDLVSTSYSEMIRDG